MALGALAVVAVACSDDDGSAGDRMDAVDFAFRPDFIAVTAGRQVTIKVTNKGDVVHNLSMPGIEADIDYQPGESTNLIFVAPLETGRVEFFCKYHRDRGMVGAFLVRD